MFAALFGFIVRLGALTVAVIAVSKISFCTRSPWDNDYRFPSRTAGVGGRAMFHYHSLIRV